VAVGVADQVRLVPGESEVGERRIDGTISTVGCFAAR
jgi:hypothetical protein